MNKDSYTKIKKHQKLYIKVYAVLCLIVLASIGFYSYQKWQEYSLINTAVEKNKDLVAVLRENVSDEKSTYELNKDGFNNMNEEIETLKRQNSDLTARLTAAETNITTHAH